MIDTPQEAAIGDKAARELLASEKALQVKHTPAPWLIEDTTVYALEHNGWRKGVEQLCNRFTVSISGNPCTTSKEELLANARLIAAAPETAAERDKLKAINSELLEALKEIDERLTACLYGNIYAHEAYDSYYQSVVRDAIVKAEGKA